MKSPPKNPSTMNPCRAAFVQLPRATGALHMCAYKVTKIVVAASPTKITAITVTFNSLNSPSKRLICEISRETALYELNLPLVQACWSSRNVGKAEKLVFKFGPIQYALHRVHHAAASLHSRVCTAGWWTGTERNGTYKRLHFMGQSASTGACRRAQWMANMCEQVVLQFTDNISICLPTEMMMMLRGAAVFMEISWKK